jgi:beta-aspartyl-peptidase (threonine type)
MSTPTRAMPSAAIEAPPPGRPALLLHGGAWAIPDDETAAHVEGMTEALACGRALLEAGRSALETVVETVAALEAHPAFDAGRGAVLDRSGRAQLDAGVMCGATLRWGAVANVRRLAHPIRIAHRLLDGDGQERLLVGPGAEAFAEEVGVELIENEALVVERERLRFARLRDESAFHTSRAFSGDDPDAPRGTVSCVALDAEGRLAAATSTGGAPYTRPGRVGDSPLVGAGYYADGEAAASATGWGEAIVTVLLCGRTVDAVSSGATSEAAAVAGLDRMRRDVVGAGERGVAGPATGGLIVLDRQGRGGWAYTTPRMARAGWRWDSDPWVAV